MSYETMMAWRYPHEREVQDCFAQAYDEFFKTFPGAFTPHRNAAFREWAALAKIPWDVFERQAQPGLLEIPEAKRMLATYPIFVRRMHLAKSKEDLSVPEWAIGHEAPKGILSQITY